MSAAKTIDVRLRGFREKHSLKAALDWIDQHGLDPRTETVDLDHACERVLDDSIVAPVDVPPFPRAMMDGFAGKAAATVGASLASPVPWSIAGINLPGHASTVTVTTGTAVRVMTGAPMPDGADVVVPVEDTGGDEQLVTILREYPRGKNVGQIGEDIVSGSIVLPAGRRLRPQDVGLVSSLGLSSLRVRAPVRVALVITGNELLPPGTPARGVQITDSNGPMVAARVVRDGGVVQHRRMVADDPALIAEALRAEADVVIVSGGSSVGAEDHAPMILARDGDLAIHGIAMRPGSPAGLGMLHNRLVALLPGNPVACLCAYDLLVGRAIRTAAGRGRELPYRRTTSALKQSIRSVVGRVDYIRVQRDGEGIAPVPISGASRLSSTTQADGFVLVSADCTELPAQHQALVYLYER